MHIRVMCICKYECIHCIHIYIVRESYCIVSQLVRGLSVLCCWIKWIDLCSPMQHLKDFNWHSASLVSSSTASFLSPRDAMLARYTLSLCVRLSVPPLDCLFVTSRCSVKTFKRMITETIPYDIRRFYFSDANDLGEKISAKFQLGHPQRRCHIQVG